MLIEIKSYPFLNKKKVTSHEESGYLFQIRNCNRLFPLRLECPKTCFLFYPKLGSVVQLLEKTLHA